MIIEVVPVILKLIKNILLFNNVINFKPECIFFTMRKKTAEKTEEPNTSKIIIKIKLYIYDIFFFCS